MIGRLTVVGGIDGFQAHSTRVVTNALVSAIEAQGLRCRVLVLSGIKIPDKLIVKWAVEFLLRYLIYPMWCRKKIRSHDFVYITDHANAGVKNWLPSNIRVIIHCHDLTSLRPMSSFPYPIRFRNRLIFLLSDKVKKKGLLSADHIIAISNFTKKELCRWLRIDAEKIAVAYNGVDHKCFYPENKKKAKQNLGLPSRRVIMTVGPASYRKNLLLVARMLAIPEARKFDFCWLHIGQLEDRARNLLIEKGLNNCFIERQGLSDDEMRAAYSAADLFLFPSLYEGFGLPPVEAMACGTPVIAAPTSAIPEILGDAALYADPDHPEVWLQHCYSVLGDMSLREKLIERGFIRMKRFDWDNTAKKILRIITAVSKEANPETI